MEKLIDMKKLPDDFKIYLEDDFRKELIKQAVKRAGGFLRLSEKIDFDWSSLCKLRRVFRMLKGRKSIYFIKISLLKKLLEFSDFRLDEIEKHMIGIAYSKHMVLMKLPLYASPELASLVAHALGDGHCSTERFKYINKSKELTTEVRSQVKTIFGIEGREYVEREIYYGVEFYGIVGRILSIIGVPIGRKVIAKMDVPNWIKDGSKRIKLAFVKALFDDEGSFVLGKKQQYITISMYKHTSLIQSHIKFLDDIRQILSELGITSGQVHYRRTKRDTQEFGFGIYRKDDMIRFSQIGFTHKVKSSRLFDFIMKTQTKV